MDKINDYEIKIDVDFSDLNKFQKQLLLYLTLNCQINFNKTISQTNNDLARAMKVSVPTISLALAVLEKTGKIERFVLINPSVNGGIQRIIKLK